jgi:hypothetical protein
VRKKIQNATYDGKLKRRKRGPMWSTKGPKPIMLPLPIHSQNPGQNPPPTVQLWRDCWCPSPSKTPTPQATLILILKGKRRWQINRQKSSPIKSRGRCQNKGEGDQKKTKQKEALEEQGISTSPHLVNPIWRFCDPKTS